jgi:hypothetical protein
MPTISMFYGIVIYMYAFDNKRHKLPHIHASYQEFSAVFGIEDSEVLQGELPKNKMRLVQAWIEIHREDLLADWRISVSGHQPQQIKPLE